MNGDNQKETAVDNAEYDEVKTSVSINQNTTVEETDLEIEIPVFQTASELQNNPNSYVKTSLNSQKDYVYLNDVIDLLPKIAINGKHSIYNIASGQNLTNEELAKRIQQITKCKIQVATNAKKYEFPKISINLIKNEFNFKPTSILDKIDEIIKKYKKKFQ